VENIIVIYPNRSDFSRQFLIVHFTAKILMLCYSAHLISLDPHLSYIKRCIGHYSAVTFWIRFCLEQIKFLALDHLAIISTPFCQYFRQKSGTNIGELDCCMYKYNFHDNGQDLLPKSSLKFQRQG
jgi:hypothetical protein